MNAGYFSASHLAEVEASRWWWPRRQRFLYHKDRFTYDEHSDSFMCPQGQTLAFVRIQHANGVPLRLYRASGAVCQACPAFRVCTRAKEIGRSLAIGPHDAVLRRHRAWMSTSVAKEAYRLRKHLVEPVSASSRSSRGHGGSYCAASPAWRPSGSCWPQLSNPVAGLALPRHPATPRAESPSRFLITTGPVITIRQSMPPSTLPPRSFSKSHRRKPSAPTCYPLHHFWDRLNWEMTEFGAQVGTEPHPIRMGQ